jgi:drug/metabolite transporter (DMT)-like permease
MPRLDLNFGVGAALAAAVLFGLGTPLAKPLLGPVSPWMLAALLYLGSGIGLALWRLARGGLFTGVRLQPGEIGWLLGAIAAGGVIGPALLMLGLSRMSASGVSLLLNAEGVFTALLAWFVFKENFDRRIALGMVAIATGSLVLAWPQSDGAKDVGLWSGLWPALAVLGACLAWAIDNNLTRKVALADASFIAMSKGLAAGTTNLALALAAGAAWPAWPQVAAAGLIGFASYGASLVLFVVALRHLGSARTGAYFSVAPFMGAAVALLALGEPLTPSLVVATALMALGIWLHLTERHAHEHAHEPMFHEHEHAHDDTDPHHTHSHDESVAQGTHHSHPHRHERLVHNHAHFPDAHHQHSHP